MLLSSILMVDIINEQLPKKKIHLINTDIKEETAELHEKNKEVLKYEESKIRELFNILQIHVL